MSALADMVTLGNRLADVGCDHGYIPIFLCQTGKIPSAIAMDINDGPLERAREHIEECGLSDCIQTRLSDGLEKLGGDEADTVLIAGMGGCLMCRIIKNRIPESVTELILQPQSDIASVRRCIREIGFCIVDEDMVEEDGKFYPMMRAVRQCPHNGEQGKVMAYAACEVENMIERPENIRNDEAVGDSGSRLGILTEELADIFGPVLLRKRHPVLKRWLEKELLTTNRILKQLEDAQPAPGDTGNSPANASSPVRDRENRLMVRFRELLHKKELITAALSYYDDARSA